MKDEQEVEAVDQTGEATDSSCKSVMGSNFILNVLIAKAVDQVWSLFESLQQAQFIRLFKVNTPGNVIYFSNIFQDITSLEIYDTEELLNEMTYIPEQEPLSVNFASAEYDSNLFLVNSQSFLFLFVIQIGLVVPWILLKLLGLCSKRAARLANRLSEVLFWNGTIRLFAEAYIDFCLFLMLNLHEVEWPQQPGL